MFRCFIKIHANYSLVCVTIQGPSASVKFLGVPQFGAWQDIYSKVKYTLIRHHCHKKRGTILGVFLDFVSKHKIYLWATLWATLTHLQSPPQGCQQGQAAVKSPDHLALRSNTSNGNLSVHSKQGCSTELLTNTNMTMTVQTSRPSSKNNYSRSSMTSIISFNIISLCCW